MFLFFLSFLLVDKEGVIFDYTYIQTNTAVSEKTKLDTFYTRLYFHKHLHLKRQHNKNIHYRNEK